MVKRPENCDICPIMHEPSEVEQALRLIEDEYWVATLREDQQFLGTAFVTLREHKESMKELTDEEFLHFKSVSDRLTRAQEKVFGAKTVNISLLMNHAYQLPNPSPHVHWHLKPRYESPVTVNMEEFTDPEFGSYIRERRPHHPLPVTLKFIHGLLESELKAQSTVLD